ncbi:MAG: histidine kinase [Chitinophagales bacterium]|jgi:two-component system LytT family sensor kinase|nr:histidine kinase [Chitinophagales bacterium]
MKFYILKKPIDYAPYLFALLMPGYAALTNNLLFKPGLMLTWVTYSSILLGLWHLNEKLLSLSDKLLVKWGTLILGSNLYALTILALDYYVLHILLPFSGFSPLNYCFRFFLTTIISSAIIEGRKWTKAREQSKIENLNLQAENMETQFNLLIQQTNPEFLFHSLDTLQGMVRSDDPRAEEYVLKLADVYRQTLRKEKVPIALQEELAFLQSYLFLMRYGKEEAIFWEMTIRQESLDYRLPVFSLQLLAENCLKHNVFSADQPLYIRIFQKNAHSISISNNYQPNPTPTPSVGIGIENLKMRYLLEGIEDGVTTEQNKTTYTTTLQLF